MRIYVEISMLLVNYEGAGGQVKPRTSKSANERTKKPQPMINKMWFSSEWSIVKENETTIDPASSLVVHQLVINRYLSTMSKPHS